MKACSGSSDKGTTKRTQRTEAKTESTMNTKLASRDVPSTIWTASTSVRTASRKRRTAQSPRSEMTATVRSVSRMTMEK